MKRRPPPRRSQWSGSVSNFNEIARESESRSAILTSEAKTFIRAAVAPNTKRAYAAQWRQWTSYAEHNDVCVLPADPLAKGDAYTVEGIDRNLCSEAVQTRRIKIDRHRRFLPVWCRGPFDNDLRQTIYEDQIPDVVAVRTTSTHRVSHLVNLHRRIRQSSMLSAFRVAPPMRTVALHLRCL